MLTSLKIVLIVECKAYNQEKQQRMPHLSVGHFIDCNIKKWLMCTQGSTGIYLRVLHSGEKMWMLYSSGKNKWASEILFLPHEHKIYILELRCNVQEYRWRHFWQFSEHSWPFSEDIRQFSKTCLKATQKCCQTFFLKKFLKITKDFPRLLKITTDFKGRPEDVFIIHHQIYMKSTI